MQLDRSQFAQFGSFLLNTRKRVLTSDGALVPLSPKDLEILLLLVLNAEEIVEKREILEKVWPDTFVEEANLSRHIFSLRKVLTKDGQRYIETIPKRGYRFGVPVRWVPIGEEKLASCSVAVDQNQGPDNHIQSARKSRFKFGILLRSTGRIRLWGLCLATMAVLIIARESYGVLKVMTERPPTVVVLPVQNFTGDASQDYICDGLTEELITQIAQAKPGGFRVIPRTSSMAYKVTNKTIPEIARELQADYVIEGSLRGSPGRLRFTEGLIRASEQDHVLVRDYDLTSTDLVAREEELGQTLAEALKSVYPNALYAAPPANLDASFGANHKPVASK